MGLLHIPRILKNKPKKPKQKRTNREMAKIKNQITENLENNRKLNNNTLNI